MEGAEWGRFVPSSHTSPLAAALSMGRSRGRHIHSELPPAAAEQGRGRSLLTEALHRSRGAQTRLIPPSPARLHLPAGQPMEGGGPWAVGGPTAHPVEQELPLVDTAPALTPHVWGLQDSSVPSSAAPVWWVPWAGIPASTCPLGPAWVLREESTVVIPRRRKAASSASQLLHPPWGQVLEVRGATGMSAGERPRPMKGRGCGTAPHPVVPQT